MFDDISVGITFVMKNFNDVKAKVDDINKSINKISKKKVNVSVKATSKNTKEISKTLKELIENAKKFSFALMTVRGVWFAIRKAMTSYLADNEELQTRLDAIYYALGSLFAPILEVLVNWLTAALSCVNALAKSLGLAGINMTNFGKSSKEAKKSLAGFDEINNLSNGDSGSASVPEVDFDKNFSDWQITGFQAIVAGILGIVAALEALKLGLGGLKSLGVGLMVAGIIFAIEALVAYLNDPSWANFGKIISGIGVAIIGLAAFIGSVPLALAGAIVLIGGILASHWEEIKQFIERVENVFDVFMNWVHEKLTTKFGIFGAVTGSFIENIISFVKTMVQIIKNTLDGLFTGVKSILDGIIAIFRGNFKEGISLVLNGIWTLIKTVIGNITTLLNSSFNRALNFISNILTSIGNTVSSKVKTIINNYIISPINKVINWINQKLQFKFGGLKKLGVEIIPAFSVQLAHLNTLPSLNVGTNYVPNDMVAEIHQGEAVIPKEFNSKEYFNNDETNDLLRQLINVVDTKEFRTYISQKDVGKAAVSYINSQSRILGGSLV